jgi:hypothetical protein
MFSIRNEWNAQADENNQFDDLGADEIEEFSNGVIQKLLERIEALEKGKEIATEDEFEKFLIVGKPDSGKGALAAGIRCELYDLGVADVEIVSVSSSMSPHQLKSVASAHTTHTIYVMDVISHGTVTGGVVTSKAAAALGVNKVFNVAAESVTP